MLESTETSQKVKVFEKKCKFLKIFRKVAKLQVFGKKSNLIILVNFLLLLILLKNKVYVQSLKLRSNCILIVIMLRQ